MDKNNQLETAPIGKLVFKLAIPTVMAQLVNLLYNIVDRIYVGRIPEIGSLSLAGLGVTFPIILLVSAFAMLAGMESRVFRRTASTRLCLRSRTRTALFLLRPSTSGRFL